MKNRTLIVVSSSVINLLLNGASQMAIARHLNFEDYAYYLCIMATVPILGVVSVAFQQTSAVIDPEDNLMKWTGFFRLALYKCLPYSIICVILGSLILVKINNLWLVLTFMTFFLNLTFILGGLVGTVQRRMQFTKWFVLTIIDSGSRLMVLLVLLQFDASPLAIIFGLIVSLIISVLMSILIFKNKRFSVTSKMTNFSYKQIQVNIFFMLFLQSDILILQRATEIGETESYIILSTLLKIFTGIGILYGQIILINPKKAGDKKFKFFQNEEFRYYIIVWIIGCLILLILMNNVNLFESIILTILNQRVNFDVMSSIYLMLAQIFILKSFFFVIANLEKINFSANIFLLGTILFYLLEFTIKSIIDLSFIFMMIAILSFFICKVNHEINLKSMRLR